MRKLLQKLIIIIPVLLVICLVGFLFKNDIEIIVYQVAVSTKIISADSTKFSVFADPVSEQKIAAGYVEYVSAETDEEQIIYPSLSSVHARLQIARIKIDGPLVEGNDESAMKYGFWHLPSASPFAVKGNTVVIGHRYLKLPPHKDTFYNLDKARVGDEVIIKSDIGMVKYKIRSLWVINSSETSILSQTDAAQLTLITCHPLWTSKQRLVIIADQIERQVHID